MALIKTAKEIEILREGGQILARILDFLARSIKPGISTLDLDKLARQEIKKAAAEPAFLDYRISSNQPPFPAALCTSIDNEIVHGIPKLERILQEGQIIGLDLGMKYKGLFTDAAITVPVGKISAKKQKLIKATKEALSAGIATAKAGNTIGDIGFAIQTVAEAAGFSVIRDLVGHGVGHSIHEKPNVPNYGKPGSLEKLVPGMVLAIEPMLCAGDYRIKFSGDGWTAMTADASPAAHFEHTVVVMKRGCLILTDSLKAQR